MFFGHHHHHHRNRLPPALSIPLTIGFVIFRFLLDDAPGPRIGTARAHAEQRVETHADPSAPVQLRHEVAPPPPAPPNPVYWAVGFGAAMAAIGALGAAMVWTSGDGSEERLAVRGD